MHRRLEPGFNCRIQANCFYLVYFILFILVATRNRNSWLLNTHTHTHKPVLIFQVYKYKYTQVLRGKCKFVAIIIINIGTLQHMICLFIIIIKRFLFLIIINNNHVKTNGLK